MIATRRQKSGRWRWGAIRRALAMGAFWLSGSIGAMAAPVLVRDVRLSADPDGTRVVFDVSAPVEPSIFMLADPGRVVVDLPNSQLSSSSLEMPRGQGLARNVRAAVRDKGVLRVVIELGETVEFRSFSVAPSGTYGHRVVLDLTPVRSVAAPPSPPRTEVATAPVAPKPTMTVSSDAARDIVIAIDAGHGGEDPGASGRRGTREKDVTLAIAKRLKARIDREPGMRAVLTRDGDYFLSLRQVAAGALGP